MTKKYSVELEKDTIELIIDNCKVDVVKNKDYENKESYKLSNEYVANKLYDTMCKTYDIIFEDWYFKK